MKFDASLLSDEYPTKSSRERYKELKRNFPKVLILFQHNGYYYGFNETAVAISILFHYAYYKKSDMLVVRIEKSECEMCLFAKKRMNDYCYIIDRYGEVSFVRGSKTFNLVKSLSYYTAQLKNSTIRVAPPKKPKSLSWTNATSRHGGGWYDDVWTPGLPSNRFYRSRKK